MSKTDIKNFYKTAVAQKKFSKEFFNELKKISTEEELKNFIEEKVQPVAKEMGCDFSTKELLNYEKQMAIKITERQLEAISGGVNAKNLALGGIVSLMAIGATSFASINFTQAMTEQDVTNPIFKSSEDPTDVIDETSKKNPQSTSTVVDPQITDPEASKMSVGSKGKIGEINYEIGYAYITLSGDSAIDIEKIPQSLLDYSKVHNKPFYIGKNIKSIKLNGDEKINIRGAFDLKKISITGKSLATYEIKKDIIELSGDSNNPIDIIQILQSTKPIKINKGVKSLTLQGDEIIDISEAYDLKKIDAIKSTKYDSDENNIALYEKGTKNIASIIKNSHIGDLGYTIEDDGILLGTDEDGGVVDVDMSKIPSALKDLNKMFIICNGIKSITLQGDEIIDISEAYDLEKIYANKSTRYDSDENNIVLYEKGTKNIASIIKNSHIGDLVYTVEDYGIILETYDNKSPVNVDMAEIPSALKDLNKKFFIRENIKSITLQGNEIIDISNAINLETLDLSKSKRYTKKDGHLYTKDGENDLGWINKAVFIQFSLDRIDELPKDEESLNSFLSLLDEDKLKMDRTETVYHQNKETKEISTETISINEIEVYEAIKKQVDDLITKVDKRTPDSKLDKNEIDKGILSREYSKHYEKNRDWRIAKAIYRWVAKNISYDDESNLKITDDEGNPLEMRKPQDPNFVFNQRAGVCAGFANLVNLMMRIAKIPCCVLGVVEESEEGHAYNAICLTDNSTEFKKVWTLIDATWASPKSDADLAKASVVEANNSLNLKTYFPLFYRQGKKVEDANNAILQDSSHRISFVKDLSEEKVNFKKSGIEFSLFGSSIENPFILLEGNEDIPIENLDFSKLPKELLKYGLPFAIGQYIKSIKLTDDINLCDTSFAFNLEKIDISGSKKYEVRDYINLYKDGKFIGIIRNGIIKGIKYKIFEDSIFLYGNSKEPIDIIEIPRPLRALKKPFKIFRGIKSITLQSDEMVDISEAWDLKKIDTTKSTKYDSDENNIALYEKGIKNITSIIKRSNIGELCYLVEDDNIFLGTDKDEVSVDVDMSKIPSVLKNLNKKFTIIAGVKSITLQGDEIIDISYATNLEEVSINGVTYKIHEYEISVDSNEQIDDTKIPQFLKDLKKPFKPSKIVKKDN